METVRIQQNAREKFLKVLTLMAGAVVVAATLSVSLQDRAVAPQFEPKLAFPAFDGRLADISSFVVHSKEHVLTLSLGADGAWSIDEKQGYPVKMDSLSRLAIGLADLELVARKTSRVDWYHYLGLGDPATGGDGIRFQALASSGEVLADVVTGMEQGLPDMNGETFRYIRLGEDPQTYISRGQIDLGSGIDEWGDLDVFSIERPRFMSVTSSPGKIGLGARGFSASRLTPNTYNFELAGVPLGYEVTSPGIANGVGSALASMNFLDVKPESEIDFSGANHLTYLTFDDVQIDVDLTRQEEAYWVRFEALDGRAHESEVEVSEDGEADREILIATLNARGKGWAFEVPNWKGDQMAMSLTAMIQIIGTEEE